MTTELTKTIQQKIQSSGPITIAEFMDIALMHPKFGYYQSADAFGVKGDFITAPEISQMFGELIGLWCVDSWSKMGAPSQFMLVEFGPGRGTLMSDALRSAALVPEFLNAAKIYLVEGSQSLTALQKQNLKDHNITWCQNIADLPSDTPAIFIGNEFLDALPIQQFEYTSEGWQERRIGLDGDTFVFQRHPAAEELPLDHMPEDGVCDIGSVYERSTAAESVIRTLSNHLTQFGGCALFIDYGPGNSAFGDSFQSVKNHLFADPLQNPGTQDLTAHVDFETLVNIAKTAGCTATQIATQGRLLERLGIEARTLSLLRSANDSQKQKLNDDLKRLVSGSEMGTLFKAMCFHAKMTETPAGFSE